MFGDNSCIGFILFCAIVGFFGSIAGIGYMLYWLFKHVAFV
jgi:hypothetical protein